MLSTSLPGQDHYDWRKVVQFGAASTDPLGQCLRRGPGNMAAPQRLLLYAFLLHLIERTEDFPRRLRMLRNLIAASENELRGGNMPALVKDVEKLIVNGDLDTVTRFSGNQVADERRKQEFLDANRGLAPALFRLEDHPILRGALSAFELDSETFAQRAQAFEAAFTERRRWLGLTGALLTFGDYQRRRSNSGSWQFGSAENEVVWRDLLTGTTYRGLQPIRTALGHLLDDLASSDSDVGDYFDHVISAWLAEREDYKTLDWRYYLVKYPSMRTGATGIYYGVDGQLGYSMCMLRTTRLNGYYRDPILLQVWQTSDVGERVDDPWFTGYETIPRWLRLRRSGVGMRSIDGGFALDIPDDEALHAKLADIFNRHGAVHTADGATLLTIPQQKSAIGHVDEIDRVVAGAAFLRGLVQAGL